MAERQIDAATAERVPEILLLLTEWLKCSRRAAKALLDKREIFVNGRRIWMAKHRIQTGDIVRIPDAPTPAQIRREEPERKQESIQVLYSDARLTVVNKPPGVESTGEPGMVEAYAERTGKPCLPVHRLDRDTSGCLIMAHDEETRATLVQAFSSRSVHKIYEALVMGDVWRPRTIRQPIHGLNAVTHIHPIKKYAGLSRVELDIETGRTHQIRIHLAGVGHPVLGDKQYSGGRKIPRELMPIRRHLLHAARIAFPDPADPERLIRVKAPHMRDFIFWAIRFHLTRPEDKPVRNSKSKPGQRKPSAPEKQERTRSVQKAFGRKHPAERNRNGYRTPAQKRSR